MDSKVNNKCSQCGAKMEFDSKKRIYKCQYCGNVINLKDIEKSNKEKKEKKSFMEYFFIFLIFILMALIPILVFTQIFFANNSMKGKNSSVSDTKNDAKDYFDDFDKEIKLQQFNSGFESYSGTENGISVSHVIDKIVTNNKKNQNKLITFVYRDINTTNPDDIISAKSNFGEWTKYEVVLDYDQEGYINKVTIMDK